MFQTLFDILRGPASTPRSAQHGRVDAGVDAASPSSDEPPTLAQTWGERRPLTVAQRRKHASRSPSFTELLPWNLYSAEQQVFELEDGQTLGLMFELAPVPCEAQSSEYLAERCQRVREALQCLPESDTAPWIVQFFVNDDRDIRAVSDRFTAYIAEVHAAEPARAKAVLNSPFTRDYIAELDAHLNRVSSPEGLFVDTQVTGEIWRGQIRRVHCFISKRFTNLAKEPAAPLSQMDQVATTLMATLNEAGIGARRCNGADFYGWMLPFFNRDLTPAQRAAAYAYPGDRSPKTRAPLMGWSLADSLLFSEPRSDTAAGCWDFDGTLVKAVTLQNLRAEPDVGHFTAELQQGKQRFARFDRLPPNSLLSITVVIRPQYQVEQAVARIRDASRARTAIAQETFSECEAVLGEIARGHKLFPTVVTLYLSGKSPDELASAVTTVNAQLTPSGLRFIASRDDLVTIDTFMRSLPFCWDPVFDERDLRRSRLIFAGHTAAMLPLYGRTRGTPNPGLLFWNRGGEPVFVDPLNKRDRKKNAHLLGLGPTGAGKSATAVSICRQTMAVHRPRLVIVDAGNSFGLMVADMAKLGLTTHIIQLNSQNDASLPPFFNADRLLEDRELLEAFNAVDSADEAAVERLRSGDRIAQALEATNLQASKDKTAAGRTIHDESAASDTADASDNGDKRDYLAEMVLSAVMMVTGGEAKEVDRLTRADRFVISMAIVRAAVAARRAGQRHPLVQDVARELVTLSRDENLSTTRRSRVEEMGHAMMVFTQGLRGKIFNREGVDWPDVDVTLVEMGTLTQDGYKDALAIAYTSLIDSVQSRGERFQAEDRPLVVVTDEGHLITTNDLLGPKIAMATKMWRKLNIWFWLLTQNLADFPDSMSRVLSMCEWWILLTMDPSEADEVARFRSLTPEQRQLVLSAKKEPPKYTEGVILSSIGQMLVRIVTSPVSIALAMTEGHEKAARRRLMEQHGCDELQAARLMAAKLADKRV
jgi:conjugative transfer ATPase